MVKENRSVILFGAGAAMDWGGPSSSYMTELIRNSGSAFRSRDGESVTQIIYNALLESGQKINDVNFETIINVIEELIVYYAYFNGREKTPSINKVLFNSIVGDEFWDFAIAGGVESHGYSLEIPSGKSYPFARHSYDGESPHQFYFQHLISTILIDISAQISKYAFLNLEDITIGAKKELNTKFLDWYVSLDAQSVVRMYTLNYDRNFKQIIENSGKQIFDGFSQPTNGVNGYADGVLELDRILNDTNSPIHYNLHGCAYWHVHQRDDHTQLNNMWVTLKQYISMSSNFGSPVLQIDRGRSIQINNIIAGYQKTQKSFATPFRQMQAAFDKDCMSADKIVVIGYSFGDYHINSSIVNALKFNKRLKLEFVDPAYSEKDQGTGYELLKDRIINIFSDVLKFERTQPLYSSDKDTCTYFEGKLKVSMVSFNRYLSMQ